MCGEGCETVQISSDEADTLFLSELTILLFLMKSEMNSVRLCFPDVNIFPKFQKYRLGADRIGIFETGPDRTGSELPIRLTGPDTGSGHRFF